MNVLELFSGIGTGQLALKHLNFKVDKTVSYEMDEMPKSIARKNFPDTDYRGDVRSFNVKDFDFDFDLIMGGSPCNDLSNAQSNRDGLSGSQSYLFFEFVRILKSVKPKYFLFENVGSMSKEDEVIINQMLGCEPIKINSKDYSPALRNRYYWTNIPQKDNDEFKNDRNLNDVLEDGWYSNRKKARALLASDSRPLTSPIKMMHRYINTGFTTVVFRNKEIADMMIKDFKENFYGLKAKDIDMESFDKNIYSNENIRYLNQRELESCQTIPHGMNIKEITICPKEFVNVVHQLQDKLKDVDLVLSKEEKKKLKEYANLVVKNTKQFHHKEKPIVQTSVENCLQTNIENIQETSNSEYVKTVQKKSMLCQVGQVENSVVKNVFPLLSEGKIILNGEEELQKKEINYIHPKNGESVLNLYGEELINAVNAVVSDTQMNCKKTMKSITSKVSNLKNLERILAICYYYAMNVTSGFTQKEIPTMISFKVKISECYTDGLTRNQSAHVLGNGWTCLVIMKLLNGMKMERTL